MKAAVLTQNQKIEILEIDLPKFEDDECLVRIKNVGICSSDIQRGFNNGAYFYPLVMGHEMSGQIEKIGKNVAKLKVGDRVAIFPLLPCFKCNSCNQRKYVRCSNYSYYGSRKNGGYAEFLNVKAWNLIKVSPSVDFEDIASLEPVSVVLHCLNRIKISKANDKKIAIIGAGFLGLLTAQVLSIKFPKCEVTIIDRNKFKLNIAKQYVDKIEFLDDEDSWKKFLENEKKNYYDVVIEATGNPQSFVRSIELVLEGGKVLWMGNIVDDLKIEKKVVSSILRKEISIIGTWNSDYDPSSKMDDWRQSIVLIKKYGLKPSKLITNWIKLEEIPEYLSKLYDHKARKNSFESIKIMVNVD